MFSLNWKPSSVSCQEMIFEYLSFAGKLVILDYIGLEEKRKHLHNSLVFW